MTERLDSQSPADKPSESSPGYDPEENMAATKTMLPCPSCGETDVDAAFSLGQKPGREERYVNAGCMVCGMMGPDSHTPRDAADRWNALPRSTRSAGTRIDIDEPTAMLLAAISTACIQNTRNTAKQRINKGNPYWTQAYGDVCDAVDREMAQRERADKAEEELRTRSATEPMMPVAEVRKLLCERCRAGYALRGDKFEQHIVPSYSGDRYLDCRATEKLKATHSPSDRKAIP